MLVVNSPTFSLSEKVCFHLQIWNRCGGYWHFPPRPFFQCLKYVYPLPLGLGGFSQEHSSLCSCVYNVSISLGFFDDFPLALVFCNFVNEPWGCFFSSLFCLGLIELVGLVSLLLSTSLKKFWPIFLQIFFNSPPFLSWIPSLLDFWYFPTDHQYPAHFLSTFLLSVLYFG